LPSGSARFTGFSHSTTQAKGVAHARHHRRPGESIVIELPTGEQITVSVARIQGNQVRLATDAPKHLSVVRKELLEQRSLEDSSARAWH
jgi:carbon storage regulator CsrA